MMTPDNEVFDAVFQLLQENEVMIYDMQPDGTIGSLTNNGPYVVMGALQLVTDSTKTQLQSRISVTLHVFGNRKQRFAVSQLTGKIVDLLSQLKMTQHYRLLMRPNQTMNVVSADKYDNSKVWHGVLDVTYAAY